MKISVIIPTYNRAKLIRETLDSVMAQSYADWEAIVVDDGSSDETSDVMVEIVKLDPRITYHVQPNSGAQVARNHGTELATGDLVMYLDSDDILHPEKLARQVQPFLTDPELDGTVCQTLWFTGTPNNMTVVWNRIVLNDPFLSFLMQDILWSTLGGLWRKSFVERIGGWRLGVKSSQDVDFHLRAAYAGHKIVFVPECLVYARDHEGPRVSGISKPGWINDVVRITDYIHGQMIADGRLTRQYAHVVAANYLWCARKQARDATLHEALGYLEKAVAIEPSPVVRGLTKTLGKLSLLITSKIPQWYYVSFVLHRILGLEVQRFNWFKKYRVDNWLSASDLRTPRRQPSNRESKIEQDTHG